MLHMCTNLRLQDVTQAERLPAWGLTVAPYLPPPRPGNHHFTCVVRSTRLSAIDEVARRRQEGYTRQLVLLSHAGGYAKGAAGVLPGC